MFTRRSIDVPTIVTLLLVSKGWKCIFTELNQDVSTKSQVYKLPCAKNYDNNYFWSLEDLLSTYCPIDYDRRLFTNNSVMAFSIQVLPLEKCLPAVIIFNSIMSHYGPKNENHVTLRDIIEYVTSVNIHLKPTACWKWWINKTLRRILNCDTYSKYYNVMYMIDITVRILMKWLIISPWINTIFLYVDDSQNCRYYWTYN